MAGRPVKWNNADEMQKAIDEYFQEIELHNTQTPLNIKHPTITGLALALDMTREGLLHYIQKSQPFADTIKKAKARVEEYIEQRLYSNNAAGCIFNLKNNFNWKDKTETELSTPEGKPLEVRDVSDKDLDARIAELTNKTREARTSGDVRGKTKPIGKKKP